MIPLQRIIGSNVIVEDLFAPHMFKHAMFVLVMIGNQEVWFLSSFWWHNVHTKFCKNPCICSWVKYMAIMDINAVICSSQIVSDIIIKYHPSISQVLACAMLILLIVGNKKFVVASNGITSIPNVNKIHPAILKLICAYGQNGLIGIVQGSECI